MKIIIAILLLVNAGKIARTAAFVAGFGVNIALKPIIWIASRRAA